jgi:hypothetical protein
MEQDEIDKLVDWQMQKQNKCYSYFNRQPMIMLKDDMNFCYAATWTPERANDE